MVNPHNPVEHHKNDPPLEFVARLWWRDVEDLEMIVEEDVVGVMEPEMWSLRAKLGV